MWVVGVLLASAAACTLPDTPMQQQSLSIAPFRRGSCMLSPDTLPTPRQCLGEFHNAARLGLRALRGGLDKSDDRNGAAEGDADDPSVGDYPAKDQALSNEHVKVAEATLSDEDDFSLGAVSNSPASQEAEQSGKQTKTVQAAAVDTGVPSEHDSQKDDDVDHVDCKFERIGDTNGVFYYLGLQQCMDITNNSAAQVLKLPTSDVAVGADGQGDVRRFRNPALTGRIQVKTGPQRIMCSSKFKGRPASPEQVSIHTVTVQICTCSNAFALVPTVDAWEFAHGRVRMAGVGEKCGGRPILVPRWLGSI